MIILIPNTRLKTGMEIMREKVPGRFEPEFTLRRFFHTSPRFPELAWETSAGGKVVYARCGSSFVKVDG